MKKIRQTFFLLLFFIGAAQAQTLKITVLYKGVPLEKAVVLSSPFVEKNGKEKEKWVYYTDSTGKRLILANQHDTITVYKFPFLQQKFILNHQKLSDTFVLAEKNKAVQISEKIKSQKTKLQKADFENKNASDLLLFLGEKIKNTANSKLSHEQQWLKYLYFLKTDLDEGGILQHAQNRLLQNKDYFSNDLLPLLSEKNEMNNSNFPASLLYFYFMLEKYKPTILQYNATHNNFWTNDFLQKIAELGATEQEIQASLARFEADLASYIRLNPTLFCDFE